MVTNYGTTTLHCLTKIQVILRREGVLPENHLGLATIRLGPYLVIISFSSTARILLKLPHGKPLFTLRMLRRTRDIKPLFFVDERYNSLYITRRAVVSLANCCSTSCNRALSTSSKQAFS